VTVANKATTSPAGAQTSQPARGAGLNVAVATIGFALNFWAWAALLARPRQ
jgi:hypothetical protein